MTSTPTLPRRNFIARLLSALAGGWLGGSALASKAAAATTQGFDAPYLGEIRMIAGFYAPVGWLYCDGQMLSIGTYDQLFTLIGTTYGGDGQTTFALPDLRSRAPIHMFNSQIGEFGGTELVTLLAAQAPAHVHALQGASGLGDSNDPAGRVPARNAVGSPHYGPSAGATFAATALTNTGSFAGHNNMMPSLGISFVICVQDGVYPSQT